MRDAADRIIFALIVVLVIFGVLAFFDSPAYEKGVWAIVNADIAALSGVLGFKFGITQATGVPKDQPPTGGEKENP